jgi:hypothetical protein
MPHFLIENTDGTVSIMQTFLDATAQDCIDKWPAEKQALVASVTEIDPADIPADRTHRNAWEAGE